MSSVSFDDIMPDRLVMSVARALTLANEAALAEGADPSASLVTITEENSDSGGQWRIHYGPRDYVGRRGGDLIIIIDAQTEDVRQVIRGQ